MIFANDNQLLLACFTEEKVLSALKSMRLTKAAGFDGFPVIFFQKYWKIVFVVCCLI